MAWSIWRGCQWWGPELDPDCSIEDYLKWLLRPTGNGGLSIERIDDPMDEETYNDATAFPLQKPNTNVFPPPPRTRKQRGWYQISRPVPREQTIQAQCSGKNDQSSSHELPHELLHQIAGQSCYANTYALVCKDWARVMQKKLFSRISLRTARDYNQIFQFICSPSSDILRCICWSRWSLKPSLYSPPFIHKLSRLLMRLERSCGRVADVGPPPEMWIEFTGPIPRSVGLLSSIHFGLPRRLPPSCSPYVTELTLSNIAFKSFVQLAQLVYELPSLTELVGRHVTWPHASPTQAAGFIRRKRLTFFVYLEECTEYWPALAFTRFSAAHMHDYEVLATIAWSIETALSGGLHSFGDSCGGEGTPPDLIFIVGSSLISLVGIERSC